MKTILLPTDFSEAALNAGVFAAQLAKETGAELHLFNVFHIPNPLQTLPIELIVTRDELQNATDSELKKTGMSIKEKVPDCPPIHIASANGHSENEIRAYAHFIHADLIMMGMKGAGKVKEKLIGSTTVSVIEKAEIPVLSVPEHCTFKRFSSILLASDGREIPAASINPLKELAKQFNSSIEVCNILPHREEIDKDEVMELLEKNLTGLRHTFIFPESENIEGFLEKISVEKHPDLLVLIPRKHNFFQRLFGAGHTKKLVFHSRIPILVLHD